MKWLKINMRKILYVIIWSIGLFVSTFFSCFANWDFSELFTSGTSVVQCAMMPIIVVLALYLWEEAEGLETNNIPMSKMKKQMYWTLVALAVSIICIGMIGMTSQWYQILFLVLSWLSISSIKLISVIFSNSAIIIKKL